MVKNSVKTHVSFPESLKTYTRILGVNAVVFSEFTPKIPLQNSREIQLLVFLFKISKFWRILQNGTTGLFDFTYFNIINAEFWIYKRRLTFEKQTLRAGIIRIYWILKRKSKPVNVFKYPNLALQITISTIIFKIDIRYIISRLYVVVKVIYVKEYPFLRKNCIKHIDSHSEYIYNHIEVSCLMWMRLSKGLLKHCFILWTLTGCQYEFEKSNSRSLTLDLIFQRLEFANLLRKICRFEFNDLTLQNV